MFLVFGWKAGQQLGGTNDLLKTCDTEDEALALVDALLHTDALWEFHITDDTLTTQYESAACHIPLSLFPTHATN